ncbi:MAG: diadenylate cyclase CdaA [Bacteroidales bacterium]|nr:diadenylate cyclase CdaA [Bacteroidales bacterium]MBN2764547.1 diadenylate cyclase CdaA [Bacteroidales bacterium]
MIPAFITVRVIDIIDILLVAILMYTVYNLIKGTIATYIFITILIFYVVWLLVKDNMLLMGSILGQIIGVGAIAIIVIFQPELRRFLILFSTRYLNKAGSSFDSLFTGLSHRKPVVNLNAIIQAVMNMSKNYTGALIALQRKSLLDAYIETGEIISAETSSRLLETIFNKNSPLHDGGVVVVDEKVKAAGCIFPISENYALPQDYGLRHRAAIGLTEQTDALVIIVSEETGSISLAEGGEIQPLDTKALLKILEEKLLVEKW